MRHRIAFTAVLAGATMGAGASGQTSWDKWHRELARQCPGNHVEWNVGSGYNDLIGAYVASLPPPEGRRLIRAADYDAHCADVPAGFICEMDAYLSAAERLGMLRHMAAFSCRTIRCEEPGICSGLPPAR